MSPLHFTYSDEAALQHGVKFGVHGRAGAGKTTLVGTLAEMFPTVLISAESGLLSIRHLRIPTIVINSLQEFQEARKWLTGSADARRNFQAVAIDSASEIAEKTLGVEKANTKDGRRAYGEMHEKMMEEFKGFRDAAGFHIYFSAKQGKFTDEVSRLTRYGPDFPGQQLIKDFPYLFDELFALEIGRAQDGTEYRYLLTKTNMQYEAKDRSGALDEMEYPHLGHVINKILAATTPTGRVA